jgi:hypothetical protein
MKIFFSPKSKLIKLAKDDVPCRLCSTPTTKNVGSLPVVPYSLEGEPSKTLIRHKKVGCPTCNSTGKVTVGNPTYTECKTCKKGSITARGVGQGEGLYKPSVCPECFNRGTKLVPIHGKSEDDFEEIPCPSCHGNKNNIPVKECPTCIGKGSEKPGFEQHGEPKHNIVCPTCRGSRRRTIAEPYTPILQIKCPHIDGIDTWTKPNSPNATDVVGPYDKNYFEGQHLIPFRLFSTIRGVSEKYKRETEIGLPPFGSTDLSPRVVGALTPPIPPISRIAGKEEPSYLDFFSRPETLTPDHQRTASNLFKRTKIRFNSKIAKPDNSDSSSNEPSNQNNELNDDFFGNVEESKNTSIKNLNDFLPEGFKLDEIPISRRTLTPEQNKRLHGGPITVRQINETDLQRPFLTNPSKALDRTKSVLKSQRTLSEKRSSMSKMFNSMKKLEAATEIKKGDSPEKIISKNKKRELGLRPSYRGWRDNLQTVSVNLDIFGQLRSVLKKKIAPIIGKNMDPVVATALTSKIFREGRTLPGENGERVNLSEHRLGITDPMPYFKNDENWHETHSGFGCDHDPGKSHEPDVGCIVDYHNPGSNPKEWVTTGINSRVVVGKYSRPNGESILQTVGARLKKSRETGLSKQDRRGSTPQWTPESFGRVVELPSDRATCVPNRIQREHYVVHHTVEPSSERSEYASLPPEETGQIGLKPEPILHKETIKFPEEIRMGGPKELVYVGDPLYQLTNPFSSSEVEHGMWANNPAVQHLAKQIKNGKRPDQFKPYIPEPKFNSQQKKDRPGLTGPPTSEEHKGFGDIDLAKLLFGDNNEESGPKTSSNKEGKNINPINAVEENEDETYDTDKKLNIQKMQRTQVHMVEPTNPSTPDITPNIPEIKHN